MRLNSSVDCLMNWDKLGLRCVCQASSCEVSLGTTATLTLGWVESHSQLV